MQIIFIVLLCNMAAMQNFCNDFYQITVPILAIFFLMYKQLLPAKLNFGDNCVFF